VASLSPPAFTLFGGGGRRGVDGGGVTGKGGGEGAATASEERERASCGDEARRERGGREGRYYWRPPRQSYRIAWALVIGRPTTSAVPFRYPLPWLTGFQLTDDGWTDLL
jgi:hypothetical protein